MAYVVSMPRRTQERLKQQERLATGWRLRVGKPREQRWLDQNIRRSLTLNPPSELAKRLDFEAKRGFAPVKTTLVKAPKRPA